MASRGRKITIEIGGEDVGASKAFKSTEDDADKLGRKLKTAGDKGGKGLREGVEGETDKLGSKLRSAGKGAGQQFESGLSSSMSGLSDAVSGGFDVGSIADSLGGALESVGGRLGPVGAGVGLAVGGALAVGFLDGMDVEKANDKLAAQLGLTAETAEEFGTLASDIYRGAWGDSIEEVNDALGAVHSSLGDSLGPGEDALKRAATQALDLAGIFEVDVTEAALVAGVAVRHGLAEDADHAFDLMTASMQKMPAGMRQELLPAIEEYGGFLSDLGFTGEQAFGLLASASQEGSFGIDKTADALKELTIRATDMSTSSVDAFEAAGLNADDMAARFLEGGTSAKGALDDLIAGLLAIEDPVERSNAAIGLFGTPLEDLSVTEIPAFLEGLSSMDTSLGDVSGAAEDAGDMFNNNAATKITEFRRKALGELTDFVGNSVIPKLEALSNWAQNNPGAFQAIAAVIAGVVVLAFTAWAISAGAAAIATIAATWPVLLVLAAVAAAIALVVIHWDTIKAAASAVWNWISENWPLLLAIITGPIGIAVLLVTRHFDTIKQWAANVLNFIVGAAGWVRDRVVGAFGWARDRVVGAWQAIWAKVLSVRDKIVGAATWVRDKITGAFNWAKGVAVGAWQAIWDKVAAVRDSITGAVDTIKDKIAGIGDAISNIPGAGTIGNVVSGVGGFLGFDVGGVVPGPVGAPMLAVVHGGETVLPTHDPAAMRSMGTDYVAPTAGNRDAHSGSQHVEVTLSAAPGGDSLVAELVMGLVRKGVLQLGVDANGRRVSAGR